MEIEYILSKVAGKEPTLTHYKRRAQIFRYVRDVLGCQEASFTLKLYALMEMTWSGFSMGMPDLSIHMTAIDALIESHGGIQVFLLPQDNGPIIQPHWITGMFVAVEDQITNHTTVSFVIDRFILTRKRVRSWVHRLQALSASEQSCRRKALENLAMFLHEPIGPALLSAESPFSMAVAPFF